MAADESCRFTRRRLLLLLLLVAAVGSRDAECMAAVTADRCNLPECYLPEPGRIYSYRVQYPEGDSGVLIMTPAYDEERGMLVCRNLVESVLHHESTEASEQYQLLPDGIYRLETPGSGVPELWLPARLFPGMTWQTGSGSHRIVNLASPCPLDLLADRFCLQVASRYHVMRDIEVLSYFAEGFGRVLSRLSLPVATIEYQLTGVAPGTARSFP